MTEVFSAIFGRKKPKAPPPPASNLREAEGFEVIGQEEYPVDARNNNNERPPLVLENQDYETLFSFLQVQNGNTEDPNSYASSSLRPVRRAPPVPTVSNWPYPPLATNGATDLGDTSNSSAVYLSGVPFQLAAGFGGDQFLRHELLQIGGRPRPIDMNEYCYSFSLEQQILDEAAPLGAGRVLLPPVPAQRRRNPNSNW